MTTMSALMLISGTTWLQEGDALYYFALLSEKKKINLEEIKLSFSLFSLHDFFLPQIYFSRLFYCMYYALYNVFAYYHIALHFLFTNHCSKISDTIILYRSYKVLGI